MKEAIFVIRSHIILVVLYFANDVFCEKIIDLTWSFNKKTIYWVRNQPFNYTKMEHSNKRGYWYASNEFQASEHGGTHLDAPYHFSENGWKIDDIPTNRLFANAVLLDFSEEVSKNGPDYRINPKEFTEKLETLGPILNNTVMMIKYGWSKYWPKKEEYIRTDDENIQHYPGLNESTARIIASNEKIVGVAIDTASIDPGNSQTFEIHRTLLGSNLYVVENTKMTEQLPGKGFWLIVAPMKLEGGSGAPTRIFAILTEISV